MHHSFATYLSIFISTSYRNRKPAGSGKRPEETGDTKRSATGPGQRLRSPVREVRRIQQNQSTRILNCNSGRPEFRSNFTGFSTGIEDNPVRLTTDNVLGHRQQNTWPDVYRYGIDPTRDRPKVRITSNTVDLLISGIHRHRDMPVLQQSQLGFMGVPAGIRACAEYYNGFRYHRLTELHSNQK